MDYILFNSDGSIKETHLNQYVQQGENSKKIEISIDGIDDDTDLLAQAFCTLPNKQTITLLGTWSAELAGLGEAGWTFSITDSVTHYYGVVLVAIRVKNTDTDLTLVTYPFALVINQTGVQPEADSGVTLEELDGYLKLVLSWIDNLNLENGEGENSLQQKGGCVAGYDHQFAVGKFNDNQSTNLFEVGNGTANDERSNAFEVHDDGRASVGAEATNNMDVVTFKQLGDRYWSHLIALTPSENEYPYYLLRIVNKRKAAYSSVSDIVSEMTNALTIHILVNNGTLGIPDQRLLFIDYDGTNLKFFDADGTVTTKTKTAVSIDLVSNY